MGKSRAKHWNRNKNRASLGSKVDAAASTTSTAGTTSGSATRPSTPQLPSSDDTSRSSTSSSLALRRASQKYGRRNKQPNVLSRIWEAWAWNWPRAPSSWLNPNQWSPRILTWKPCCVLRWIYNFCITLSRIRWDTQCCGDFLVTVGAAALYMFVLYMVIGFAVSRVASAQEMDADCSVVYVTIPGPIITVSLIATSPTNPARGTYYFSVINGTTGWLDSIAPPSRFSTLQTKTPDSTPIISSLSVTTLPPGQPPTLSIGSSGTSVSPSFAPAPPGPTVVFTTTLLSGSTLVTTVITAIPTVNLPVLPPSSTSSVSLLPTRTPAVPTTTKPIPANEPQRPWPSPVLPSSSIMLSTGLSGIVPTLFPPDSRGLVSSTLVPPGIQPSGSISVGLSSSPVSTIANVTPGVPSNALSTDQRTTSTTLVILTSTVSGGSTTTLTSTLTTVLPGVPPTRTAPTVAPVTSTAAITLISTTPGGATTTIINLSTTIIERTTSSVLRSPTVSMASSLGSPLTSTFPGGATSVIIGSRSPTGGNFILSTPTTSQILTTLTATLPGGLTTVITTSSAMSVVPPSPTTSISVTSAALLVSSIITTATGTASNGQPTTSILTVITTISQVFSTQIFSTPPRSLVSFSSTPPTTSGGFIVSLPNPSTRFGVSSPPSATSVFMTTTTQISSGLTTTITLVSSTFIGVSSSSSALPPAMTTVPSSLSTSGPRVTTTSPGSVLLSATPPPPSSLTSAIPSLGLVSSFPTGTTPGTASFPSSSSTISPISTSPSTGSSTLASFPTVPASVSTTTTTTSLTPTFLNTSSIITSSSFIPGLPPVSTSSLRFNTTSSSLSSLSLSTSLSSLSSSTSISSSALTSRASQSSSPTISVSLVTGFMSIQTETTARRSPFESLSSSSISFSNTISGFSSFMPVTSSLQSSAQTAATSTTSFSITLPTSSFSSNSAASSSLSSAVSSRSITATSAPNVATPSSIWSSSQASNSMNSASSTVISPSGSIILPSSTSTTPASLTPSISASVIRSSSIPTSLSSRASSVAPSVTPTSSLGASPGRSESSALVSSIGESASAIRPTESLRPGSTPSPAGSLTPSVPSTGVLSPGTPFSSLSSTAEAAPEFSSNPEPEPSFSFQVRDRTTKVISYGDTAISFVFPSPDITTTVSYWTGVYPTVTGPLPSDLQTIPLTTRTDRQTPLSALPSFELFTSKRRSFKTVVTTVYDEDAEEGMEKRQEIASMTQIQNVTTTVMTIPADAEPTLCGESGNFTLTFDDTVVGNDDNLLLVANGMKNPYHHLFYANGFTYVPDKWEPFPAISQPNVAMFLPLTGRLFPNTPFAGTLLPGEIGAGPRASVNAYWFNAYSAYFGCALNGLTPCTLRISGYRYDAVLKEEVLVVEQNATIPACWGYIKCRLTPIFFNEQFRALSGIQFNAYTYNLGIPQVHMMDDLQMEWYNSTCSAGILRIGHV